MIAKAELRRGWCPSLRRPMPSGDGLLVRLHLPCVALPPGLARGIALCARRFGNGLIDLTRHGNLQLRGAGEATLPDLRAELATLLAPTAGHEPEATRNIIASPLAGLDPAAACDIRPIVATLEEKLAADPSLHALPAKFCILVDDGGALGLDDIVADIRLVAMADAGGPRFAVALGGNAADAVPLGSCAITELPEVAAALARAFLDLRGAKESAPRRMAELVEHVGIDAIAATFANAAQKLPHPYPPHHSLCLNAYRPKENGGSWGEGDDQRRRSPSPHDFPLREIPPSISGNGAGRSGGEGKGGGPSRNGHTASREAIGAIGFHPLGDGLRFIGIGVAFGRLSADQLEQLAEAAEASEAELRLTPWRTILIASIDAARAEELRPSLGKLGLVTEPDDPRLAIAACPGAPACANASVSTREDAPALARLAHAFAREPDGRIGLHLSGCVKGCAKSDATPVTLIGREGRYDLVLDGRPGDAAAHSDLTASEAETLLQRIYAERRRPGDAHTAGRIGTVG